jgi:endonuclease G
MDYRQIFSDRAVAQEFLDRFSQLAGGGSRGGSGGLESFEPPEYSTDEAAKAVRAMRESTGETINAGLEAIILKFGRPAYFVQDDTFNTASAPSSSEAVNAVVNNARAVIEAVIPSVGRINLRDHRAPWVGTGWLIAPNVLVTNRHVAQVFAERQGDAFVFVENQEGRRAKASLDTYREHQRPKESVFGLKKVLWIEPNGMGHPDVAFLSVDDRSEDDVAQPAPIQLMDGPAYDALAVQSWAAVIGYPAFSTFNDAQDQQRIFDGVFNVKRMQPGLITAKGNDGVVAHDATTLGGNSGSAVIDLTSGKAGALHFGGLEGQTNSAVAAPVVARLLQEKVG